MKLIFVILLLAAISCNNKEEKKETMNMPGAYSMLSQTMTDSTGDSVHHITQLKIYTDDYMMYAHINAPDSVSAFGISTYSVNDTGTVTEHVLYHASVTAADSIPSTYTLQIEKTAKGYKQIIPEMQEGNRKVKLTEEYETVGDTVKTALDGIWKETSSYNIKGTDTTAGIVIQQFKAYYAGHFIFGHTYTDSAGKYHAGIGFGTFTMSDNKAKENVATSTYYEVRGKSFDLDIEMNGTDAFKQTITFPDGMKEVEFYRRLKK